MPPGLFPAVVVLLLAGPIEGPPKDAPPGALDTLVQAFNGKPAETLHSLLAADSQEALPLSRLKSILQRQQRRYGKIVGELENVRSEGAWQVYRARGEKRHLTVRVAFGEEGKITGLQFLPAFLSDLPAGPISLAEVKQRLGAVLEESLIHDRLPSVSLALVKDDQIVWAEAYGCLNMGKRVPADPETVYVTGSIFKLVIATALLQLVDEGKLDLDQPVKCYLKRLQVPNPFEDDTPLTARHLLSHRGGLPNWGQTVPLWRRELPTPMEELLKKQARVVTRPGEKVEYTNLGYTLNAYLLEQITGRPLAAVLQDGLFEPLEMRRTRLAPTPTMTENLALPYQTSLDGKSVIPCERVRYDIYPAGDAYSTPSDMARFLIPHLNGGKYRGRAILSPEAVAEMAREQFPDKPDGPKFGLGWAVARLRGRNVLMHSGAVPGFCSCVMIDPAKRLGAVLFTNHFDVVAAGLRLADDPLPDLAVLALELLDRLGTAAPTTGATGS